ncbi:MAG TPA: 5'-nucleotidase, partial [Arenimonas sp.]|nr:5'-nucleotidase [Arenimonas sp.]
LEEGHRLFLEQGLAAYTRHQREREDEPLQPGVACPLVRKLLALNERLGDGLPRVEVILISRNSCDTGLRIFNSIEHLGLDICRAAFTNGAPPFPYIAPFHAQLFLSTHGDDVVNALRAGVAAATIWPRGEDDTGNSQIRLAFDGDAMLFADDSDAGSAFRSFLSALHQLQAAFPVGTADAPIRTALITERSAPAHRQVIATLRDWGVRLDEALFLDGRGKQEFLRTFGADIFFDGRSDGGLLDPDAVLPA